MIKSKLVCMLQENDKKFLEKELEIRGYYTIEKIKQTICDDQNMSYNLLDVDTLILIDLHIDRPIFISCEDIMSHDDVMNKYDLDSFGLVPQKIFNKQYIKIVGGDYFLHDCDVETQELSEAVEIYETQVYLGKDKFDEFLISYKMLKSIKFINNIGGKLLLK